MQVDEEKLRDLLSRRKKYFRSTGDIVASGVALGSYIMTIIYTFIGVKEIPKVPLILGIIMLAIYAGIFIYSIVFSRYSIESFYKDITACNNEHNFSLILLKDNKGRFLLKYDKRWKTFLFPYTRTKEDDVSNIKNFAKESLNLSPIEILTTKEDDFTKHSVSANMTKTYHHIFYNCSYNENQLPGKDCFKINGVKYKWFSINNMKENNNLLIKNKETIVYVEKYF